MGVCPICEDSRNKNRRIERRNNNINNEEERRNNNNIETNRNNRQVERRNNNINNEEEKRNDNGIRINPNNGAHPRIERQVKQNNDRNINIIRNIPNNINDSNSSDSENNNHPIRNENVFARNNIYPIRNENIPGRNNNHPIINENIPPRNNNRSNVDHLQNYLRNDLGEHFIRSYLFEKGAEVLEHFVDKNNPDNNLENLNENNFLNDNNVALNFENNNFNPSYNLGNDLYGQNKGKNILGDNSKFLEDNYPKLKGFDSPNIIQNDQNEFFNQNTNPNMNIFNQLDINHDNVLSKEEIMKGSNLSPEMADDFINKYDSNGNGVIEPNEMPGCLIM